MWKESDMQDTTGGEQYDLLSSMGPKLSNLICIFIFGQSDI
jgi:hypothetical protein